MAKRRGSQTQAAPQGKRPRKQGKRKNDIYEAEDSDPEEVKHADRYDRVENYEYELPSDFEDEEIDEDMAFTAEDKKLYAGWFGDDNGGDTDARVGRRPGHKARREFADLESSEEEEEEDDGGEDDAELEFEDGGDMLAGLDGDGGAGAGTASEDDLLGGDLGDEEEDLEDDGDDDDDDEGPEDDEKFRDMLAAALGRDPGDPVRQRERRRAARLAVASEALPESEFHAAAGRAAGAAGEGEGGLRVSDLVAGLGDARARLGASGKLLERLERRSAPVEAPLPRAVRERVERKAGYEETSKDVTKWQPMVKANREAPTLRFTTARHEVPDRGASTAALLEGFKPEGDMEAEVAELLARAGAAGSKAMDEAERALAEQKLTPEEYQDRAARLARMRNVLFYAEQKAKRLSKIKSKEFHRRANKAAKRAAARTLADGAGSGDDQEEAAARRAAREEAEFERARERLTLKHKNSSRWARRALKRGAQVMDDTTKAALAEQMALGAALRRRIEGRGSGSDDGSGSGGSTSASDGEGDGEGAAGGGGGAMGAKSRKEALGILRGLSELSGGNGGAAAPEAATSGLFALPFMKRALEKQRQQAMAEAQEVLKELEGADGGGSDGDGGGGGQGAARFSFGGADAAPDAARRRQRLRDLEAAEAAGGLEEGDGSDEEEDAEAKAERLGRRLRGEPEPPKTRQRRGSQRRAEPAAAAAAALPARGLRRGASAAATAGPVDVDMGGEPAAAPKQQQQRERAARAGGALEVASASNAAPGARDWLFDGPGAAAARRQQQGGAGAGAAGPGTGSAPAGPAFVPASTFGGPKAGYSFKRGPRGVGYYRDKAAAPAGAASAPEAANGAAAARGRGARRRAAGAAAAAQQQQGDSGDGEERQVANGDHGGDHEQQQQQHDGGGAIAAADGDDDDAAHHMVPLRGGADAQRALLRRAFASDDVAAEFAAEKAAQVEEQLPKEEVPGLMPGWGLWADQQREPKWMAEARLKAARRKEAAAAARKDARLAHVVVTEKWDKKAAKYKAAALPFPFKSTDAYENSIRQPLGRDVNPDAAFRNLTRPAVIKSAGAVIEPLRYSKGVADYGSSSGAKARGVVTVAGGVPLHGEGRGAGAGGGAAGEGAARKEARKLQARKEARQKQKQQPAAAGGKAGKR